MALPVIVGAIVGAIAKTALQRGTMVIKAIREHGPALAAGVGLVGVAAVQASQDKRQREGK